MGAPAPRRRSAKAVRTNTRIAGLEERGGLRLATFRVPLGWPNLCANKARSKRSEGARVAAPRPEHSGSKELRRATSAIE
eukprot:scaffold10048_cov68-Phaeocystis_antarctica.AAC.6